MTSKILGALSLALLVGCSSAESKQSLDRESSHLRWLVRLYVAASQHNGPPKNEAELKQAIAGMDAGMLDRALAGAKVESADELFVSERDGLPYVILYGKRPRGANGGIVGYEQQGIDGSRYVGYTLGMVEEADQQQFEKLVPSIAPSHQ